MKDTMYMLPLILAFVSCVAKAAFDPHPVGIWMMNTDSGGTDTSGTGNDATPHDVTLTTGPTGEENTAYRFHGRSTSYLSIENSSSMDVGANGSFAFTAFVKTEKSTAAFLEYVHASQPWCLHIWNWDYNNLYVNLPKRSPFEGQANNFDKNLPIMENAWHFIGVSYNKEQQWLLGIVDNKTDIQSFGGWTIESQSTEILLGKRGGAEASYLLGEMSCAMLFSTSLSEVDIHRAKKYCLKNAKPQDSTFKKYANGTIPAVYRLEEQEYQFKLDCARNCEKKEACMSFSYNRVSKHCVLSNVDFFSESVSPDLDESDAVSYSIVFPN